MGFRDLHEFNLVLIAKQCWRLITEPDSLGAKTLKDLYFPNENFLQARKDSQASWARASLLQGRDILLQDAHLHILDSSQVRLWVDNWIPGFEVGRLQPWLMVWWI
ncbi:PREDICTED: reverse mRNAase [Prunus dulcis]|uniref:PREDICTED: reverse mRNAase n=1 Tax=Prunus dulcis TaxID=3755 RepID=A0A5E4GIF0_PRUDU|nr:PREDICTED: reverse mRNAase [Prunus dulcis]